MKAWVFATAAGFVLAAGFLIPLTEFWQGLLAVTFILLLVFALYSNK